MTTNGNLTMSVITALTNGNSVMPIFVKTLDDCGQFVTQLIHTLSE